jgi:aldose 1-epimerase
METAITHTPFGTLPDGRQVCLYTLQSHSGIAVSIADFGGVITALSVPDRHGAPGDIVLGFDTLDGYLANPAYFGALIGRSANRIAKGRFLLDGEAVQLTRNHGPHHLHGGYRGFHQHLWQGTPYAHGARVGLVLSRRSPDGEEGYPGNADLTVSYELHDTVLEVRYHAVADRATPVNLTQHSYFNLKGDGDILGHAIQIAASAITEVDGELIPTGALRAVAGTAFDLRAPCAIGRRLDAPDEQLLLAGGFDHNFVLDAGEGPAVRLHEPLTGRVLELFTDQPGLQFYTGNFLDGSLHGKGRVYGHRSGLCIEPQHFPDAPNHPGFPSTILRPDQEFISVSKYKFSTD